MATKRKHTAKTKSCAARASRYVAQYIEDTKDDPEDAVSDLIADLMHLCHLKYPKYGHSHANLRRGRLAFEDEADGSWRNA